VSRQPDWTQHNVHDPGIVLVELLAFLGDFLSYYQDQVAAESAARKRWRAIAVGAAAAALWCCRSKR
jgi:hypothetical protein